MHRLAIALALLAASPALAGCLAGEVYPPCRTPAVQVFHHGLGVGASAVRGEEIPLVIWVTNRANVTIEAHLRPSPAPIAHLDGGRAPTGGSDNLTIPPHETRMDAFWLSPNASSDRIELEVDSEAVEVPLSLEGAARELECDFDINLTRSTQLEHADEASRAEPGKGVLVHTVGWWENGTSFYTNHQGYHDADLPQGYLGPYEGSEPLKVYVYNESGDEMPERYNESGYVTTIPGFNEALKDIPTVGGRLAYLEPDEAYTREGYEEHPLYGDPLVFYIEAVEVRRVPCEVPQPVCMPPDEGDVPPGPLAGP